MKLDEFYHLQYSHYWLHIYCYTDNALAHVSFGLHQLFYVKVRKQHGISIPTLFESTAVDCSYFIKHKQLQVLRYSKYFFLFIPETSRGSMHVTELDC